MRVVSCHIEAPLVSRCPDRAVANRWWLLVSLAAAVSGCGWWQGRPDDEVADDVVSEAAPVAEAPIEVAPAPPVERLALNLKVGDRFPLLKTVEQQLRQPVAEGREAMSRSTLEMLLSVTVEEIHERAASATQTDPQEGHKRLQVKYHRVRFSQTLPGRNVEYDSQSPPNPIPLEAQAYHGLKDNSFQFWLDSRNQIREMVGFDEFLERCLIHVAPAHKRQAREFLAANSGADGIANFVDDSIGLLPPQAVRVGDTWTKSRQILQPVLMHVDTQYTLRKVNAEVAEIDLLGSISPSTSFGPRRAPDQDVGDVHVSVRGGHCFGNCQIDRRTGLPIHSRVEQIMQMTVHLEGGVKFDQSKTTVTTIGAFVEQGPQTTVVAPSLPAQQTAAVAAPLERASQ